MSSFPENKYRQLSPNSFAAIMVVLSIVYAGLAQLELRHRSPQPQLLPIVARLQVNGQVINLEGATTPEQIATGLMYRTAVAESRGILFNFNPPRSVELPMKNIVIPLDIVYLQSGQIKAIQANVPPCTRKLCPTYESEILVDQVIQLAAGRAGSLGLKLGDRLVLQKVNQE